MALIIKAPTSELDWPISYTLAAGETISGSTWTVSPVEAGGMAVKGGTPSITGSVTACILTGGNFRQIYEVTNTVTTSQGRVYAHTAAFRIGTVEAL